MPCSTKRCAHSSSTTLNKKPTECTRLVAVRLYPCSSMKCQTCMPPRDAVPIRKDLVRPCCDAESDRDRKTLAKKHRIGLKQVSKENVREERRKRSEAVAKIDERRPMLGCMMWDIHHVVHIAFVTCRASQAHSACAV